MDMFEAANPTAKSLGDSTQMEPEEQAVSTCTEAEIYFPIHLEPPSLLKIRNCKKSAKRKFKPRINLLQAKAPLSAARALPTAGQFHQMHVVLRELRLPDEVRRGSAPERPAEPRRTADLQRVEVEQHRGDAALRQVPEPRLVGPRLPIRPRDARRPGAHRQHQAAESELAKDDPIRGKKKKKKSGLWRRGTKTKHSAPVPDLSKPRKEEEGIEGSSIGPRGRRGAPDGGRRPSIKAR
ncbi:hypothetical protein BHM03_00007272 [Ensete ventricosum]|uniref:Uncharacterized protein n=1 Tax=Ensete ventricosum TaxID=4639 RepID=A0A445MBZ6_ENSVE|nr:hypothetical protein BHM03_00007272 [Ensete ventricosum]